MTVAVVVPAYNVAPYIGQCLQSVLNQDYNDLQIIVVDDGSTDQTPGVLAEFARVDPRISVIRQENAGLSAARNTALRHVKAPFVTMLDGDDMLLPGVIKQWVEAFRGNPSTDMVISNFTYNPRVAGTEAHITDWECITGRDCLRNMLYRMKGYNLSACGRLMRTSLLKDITFPVGKLYEDFPFMWRVLLRCKYVLISQSAGYYYRQRPGSILNTFTPNRLDILDHCENIVHELDASEGVLLIASKDRLFSAACNILGHLQRNGLQNTLWGERCWRLICDSRLQVLFDSKSRMRNRLTAFISPLLGKHLSALLFGRFVN